MKLIILTIFSLFSANTFEVEKVHPFSLCLNKCEERIHDCVEEKSDCVHVLKKCIQDHNPEVCLSSVNGLRINRILQCFDQHCGDWGEQAKNYAKTLEFGSLESIGQ